LAVGVRCFKIAESNFEAWSFEKIAFFCPVRATLLIIRVFYHYMGKIANPITVEITIIPKILNTL